METALPIPAPLPRLKGRKIVIVIGIFKLFKGTLCVLTAAVILSLTNQQVIERVREWANALDVAPLRRTIGDFVVKRILGMDVRDIVAGAAIAALYATLFLTEGIGLLLNKGWAEWMVVISSAGLIPLEIVEIWRHRYEPIPLILTTLTFIGNVLIVIYLAHHVRNRMRLHHLAKLQAQRNSTGI